MSLSNSPARSVAEDVFRELISVLKEVKDPKSVFADLEKQKALAAELEKQAQASMAVAAEKLDAADASKVEAEKTAEEAKALRAGLQAKHSELERQIKSATDERIQMKTELAQKIADADAAKKSADEAKKIADARTADA